VAALQKAIRNGFRPAADDAIERAPVAVTLAGDGGPVRRSAMTVFTMTVPSPLLECDRTLLAPVWFLLGGEQAIHSAEGERSREELKRALLERYIVPVEVYRSTTVMPLPYFIQVCGD